MFGIRARCDFYFTEIQALGFRVVKAEIFNDESREDIGFTAGPEKFGQAMVAGET
jgi:hypothetical protein